jgi:transketolase
MNSAVTAQNIRRIIIEHSHAAHVGHIGSALSVADIIALLFSEILTISAVDDPMRDRFILSKGHAALALYGALHLRGIVTASQLRSYCTDGTLLSVHPDFHLPGIDYSTGSLGNGLGVAAGIAFGARLKQRSHKVFVLLSDAECNEGSVWEAVMFAAHHGLSSLVAIIDNNGQQALGETKDILDLRPLDEKWRSFGWNVLTADGHSAPALTRAFAQAQAQAQAPSVIIANTVMGHGVSFMENDMRWHYLPLSDAQYAQAMAEIDDEGRR